MIVGTREQIDKYFAKDTHVSQSQLKALLAGVQIYESLKNTPKLLYFQEPAEEIIRGNAVDCLVTRGREAFDNEYYISTLVKKPSDAIISIINYVFDKISQEEDFTPVVGLLDTQPMHALILEAAQVHNWNPNWGDEARIKNIINAGIDYWNEKCLCGNKQILSMEENSKIMTLYEATKTHPLISSHLYEPLRINENGTTLNVLADDDWIMLYQIPLYFSYQNLQCKALPDIIRINHTLRLIQIVDLKVIFDTVKNFPYLMRKRGLNFQLAFYNIALKNNLSMFDDLIQLSPSFSSLRYYTIVNPAFVVLSSTYEGEMNVFRMSDDLLTTSIEGVNETYSTVIDVNGTLFSKRHPAIQGIDGAIKLYKRYITNDTDSTNKVLSSSYIDFNQTTIAPIIIDMYGALSYSVTENVDPPHSSDTELSYLRL